MWEEYSIKDALKCMKDAEFVVKIAEKIIPSDKND